MQIFIKNLAASFLILLAIQAYGQCPTLVWSDEFTGTELDLSKWEPMIGDGCSYGICGWGNNELQYYKAENAVVNNGTLKIVVKKEKNRQYNYTSARLRTKGLADFTFGRFEARIKLLQGQGLWPAFWMLSSNEPYGGWPQSGEIDIMELIGQDPEKVHGTIHYGDPYPNNQHKGKSFDLYNGIFADNFHVFAIEWEPGQIRWYMDDILYQTITSEDVSPFNFPFDASNQMHFLLNVAVGGNWPGSPDATTPFPNQMEVDYVRVYDNGFHPSISGNRLVSYQAAGEVYTINNAASGSSFNWNVPSGATITSGQGTNSISVQWGSAGGNVTCDVSTNCINRQYKIDVTVEPNFIKEFTFENFDEPGNIILNSYTGTFTEVSNPNPTGINTSALSAEYIRNSQEQYDVIAYQTSAITDASLYKNRSKKFYMDVQTNAPVGTEILIQLENSGSASATNYPTGRHSRYVGKITKNGEWERIEFDFMDAPDGSTSDTSVDQIIILFASNSFTGDTYYWDNFDSYKADDGSGGTTNNPPVASYSFTTLDLTADFDGSSSSDSDGTISTWSWDFGDGITGNGSIVSHTYAASGDYNVTLTVSDNDGATGFTSQVVSVASSGGTSSTMHVQSIVTGTESAGSGQKRGTAIVVIHDNNEVAVGGATVTGTFSGTFNETVSGVTASDGSVTLKTSGTSRGGVTINLCVDGIAHSVLTYDPTQNNITCTGSSARQANLIQLSEPVDNGFYLYPNPFKNNLRWEINLKEFTIIDISIHNLSGQVVYVERKELGPGYHEVNLDLRSLERGIYIIDAKMNNLSKQMKLSKIE